MLNSELKLNKAKDILIYILLAIMFIYGIYAFTRGLISSLNLIEFEGLKTPYYLIFGSFLISLSIMGIIYVISVKRGKK